MDQLSSELLLQTFKQLDSKEMVKIMRVCRRWFEIIDSNKSLWRSLVLSEEVNNIHQFRSILELFDRKSQSSLEEVDMKLGLGFCLGKADPFVQVLTRSKETLQILVLSLNYHYRNASLSEAPLIFPHLVDCRIIINLSVARRVWIKARDQAPLRKCSPSLKVLWVREGRMLRNSTQLLANLSSLRVDFVLSFKQCRDILETPSRSLKHLHIQLVISRRETDFHPPPLDFPQLQILELLFAKSVFPSWIKIPSSSTLILRGDALSQMPSVSAIWTRVTTDLKDLSGRCPVLINLRLERTFDFMYEEENSNLLLEMLRQRKENVRNHFQVDEIEMMPLKTLTIPFSRYKPDEISQMRSLVEEVIDLETVPDSIELEI